MEFGCQDKYNYISNSIIYEDFVPTSELVHGKDYDTLLVNIPGFKKEEIKIALYKTGILKISGERPVNKFLSFEMDIHVPTNCDKTKIYAKLSNGVLYIKHPKLDNVEQTQVVKPDKSMKHATAQSVSDLSAKLKVTRNVMNIALATLVVLGIGRGVVNMVRSSKKAKE